MYLAKELFEDLNSGYTKIYNENGQIIFEKSNFFDHNNSKAYTYNEQGKLSRIIEIKNGTGDRSEECKYLHVYEYNEENFRVICYKTERRDSDDINSDENVIFGRQIWHKVDEVVSLKEYKFCDGLLISEQHYNLEKGEHNYTFYRYHNAKKISQVSKGPGDKITEIKFIYKNDLLQKELEYVDNVFKRKKVFIYENNLLHEEQIIFQHDNTEYIAYSTKYYYNEKGELIKSEEYGRYNSTLYLYKISEVLKDGFTITNKTYSISYYNLFTGYFDLQSLNEYYQKEIDDKKSFVSFDESFIDNLKFDVNFCTVDVFNYKGDLVERREINLENNELYTRLHYHNEYNDEGDLILTICFDVTKNEVKRISMKQFVYK